MPIAREAGGNFVPAPAGTHVARCIGVISLGTLPQPQGGKFMPTYKIMLQWELPDEPIEVDGQRKCMVISKEYSLSIGKKSNLCRDLVGWRGVEFTEEERKGFEVSRVLDKPCMLSVIHATSGTGSTYAKITGISKLPKNVKCPDRIHELIHYELESGRNDVFQALPEWVRKKIETCEEWVHPPVDREPDPEAPPDVSRQDEPPIEDLDVPF